MIAEYVARRSPVWPEMLAEIAAHERRHYSPFLSDEGRADQAAPPLASVFTAREQLTASTS